MRCAIFFYQVFSHVLLILCYLWICPRNNNNIFEVISFLAEKFVRVVTAFPFAQVSFSFLFVLCAANTLQCLLCNYSKAFVHFLPKEGRLCWAALVLHWWFLIFNEFFQDYKWVSRCANLYIVNLSSTILHHCRRMITQQKLQMVSSLRLRQ